jgi:hypothetical protein
MEVVLMRGMLVVAVLLTAACATGSSPAAVAPVAVVCEVGDTALVRDVLYFGRNRPDGGTVSDAEWLTFLDEVVTPRFPAGLTIVSATGQWRGATGAGERERAEVVTIFHARDATADAAVAEVAAEYRRRFRQEAVLRERTRSCARFE